MKRYERRSEELASLPVFVKRIISSLLIALGFIAVSLSVGLIGYHWIAGFDLVDSLLESSMILGGMGPVKELPSSEAKIFAAFYALFSGLVLIAVTGFLLAPLAHRLMHSFHIDEEDVKRSKRSKK